MWLSLEGHRGSIHSVEFTFVKESSWSMDIAKCADDPRVNVSDGLIDRPGGPVSLFVEAFNTEEEEEGGLSLGVLEYPGLAAFKDTPDSEKKVFSPIASARELLGGDRPSVEGASSRAYVMKLIALSSPSSEKLCHAPRDIPPALLPLRLLRI